MTITLTRSDGNHFSYTPTDDIEQTVFNGLNDQKEYSWSSSATNRCGTTAGYGTPGFQPGIAPAFTRDDPSLAATHGRSYHYRFHATGQLKPTYALLDAPAWLSIDPTTGALSGVPPVGTTDFVYSVTATNHVGEDFGNGPLSVATAGPFTVDVSP